MTLLDRYIGKTVAANMGVVLTVLLALFSFVALVGELEFVGQGKYNLWRAVAYISLTLPSLAYQIYPTVALLGCIIGLGVLASNNELTVMRAAGLSVARVTLAVMKTAGSITLLAIFVGEWLAPQAEQYAQILRSAALAERESLATQRGFWVRDGESFVSIRTIISDDHLEDITIYDFSANRQLSRITHARSAYYEQARWRMIEVAQSDLASNRVSTRHLPEMSWGSNMSPRVLGVTAVKPERLSAVGLYHYIRYLKGNELRAARYELAFWKKLTAPITAVVMVFLAIPFVFGSLRSITVGARIVTGVLVGIIFHLGNEISGYAGLVYQVPPIISAVAPTALFLLLAMVLMRRVL